MGFTINFNVGVVQKVIQYQSVSDKDDRDQEKKKDKKPETVVEDNGEEKKNKEKKPVSTAEDNGEEKKKKKKEKKTVSTAVFAVHCGRCIRKVCEVLAKIKGIRDTVIDVENNHVTVKGEMDMMALAEYLGRKLKKAVVIVQVNDNGGGAGAGEEEKEGDKNGGAPEYGVCPYGCPYPKGYPNLRPNGYGSGYLTAAEQMFSDENPNACSVM